MLENHALDMSTGMCELEVKMNTGSCEYLAGSDLVLDAEEADDVLVPRQLHAEVRNGVC